MDHPDVIVTLFATKAIGTRLGRAPATNLGGLLTHRLIATSNELRLMYHRRLLAAEIADISKVTPVQADLVEPLKW